MRLLVADDDPLQREVLAAQLTAWGHDTLLAESGTQAWDHLSGPELPRVALLDWMMPPPDGPELCRRLRARESQDAGVYVILVTSKNRTEDVAAGLDAGADDYITKPVDSVELRARLDVGLRVMALRQRLLDTERLRVLGEAAGAAAHEIRQPLALIQATVQLSQRDADMTGKRASRYESILDAVRRIDGIIESMASVDTYRTRRYVDDEDIIDFGPGTGS